MKPPYAIGSVPSLSGHANAYRWRSLPRVRRHRASEPQGNSERVLPWQITMDQLIFASLSHTHYWYEVGTYYEKSKRNKRTQKSQHTRDNRKTTQKNKAPHSQMSQATCRTKEIDRAHRSHSTREAKQNKTNKKNQGSPIKTMKSHDSILVPLLGRGVFTAGFAPATVHKQYAVYNSIFSTGAEMV